MMKVILKIASKVMIKMRAKFSENINEELIK